MKRFFVVLVSLVLISNAAFAGKDKAITIDQLPQTAQQLIKKYFSNTEVSYAKMETDVFDKSYEVIFVNGCKVEFDKKGEWKEVNCKYAEVPAGIVPSKIQEFLTKNHSNAKVLEIDKDKRDYELKLNNGIELRFDLKENFMGYDD
jgi:hypothetical protein